MRWRRAWVAPAALAAFFAFIIAEGRAAYLQDGVRYAPNSIVVAFKPDYSPLSLSVQSGTFVTGLSEADALNRQYEVIRMWPLFPRAEEHGEPAMAGYYSLTFSANVPLESILAAYASLSSVDHVEPVGIHEINFTPNDPSLSSQWALTKIQARQAWDISRGSAAIPLGIADTGVDWDHPDLAAHIWTNSGEIAGNGVDDDANGYIDDVRGWDWVTDVSGAPGEDSDTPDNNPMDFAGHGTHVSGIASAVTNNGVGIAGVAFNCKIMCLRIGWLDIDGNGYVLMDFAASAFYYAANEGAKAVNCSWESSNSGGIATAVAYAVSHGINVVSAAGNNNNQILPYLCNRTDVICVAATDETDHKASFSNYGSNVDVCAPGVNIYSTMFNNTYDYLDGTSMSAPHVTGLVGLIRAVAPSYTYSQVITRIKNTADSIYTQNPGYIGLLGTGRINAYEAVHGLASPVTTPIPISPIGNNYTNAPHPTFVWRDTSNAVVFQVQVDQNFSFPDPDVNDSTITDTTFVCPDSLTDATWYWRVRAGNGSIWSNYTPSQSFRIDSRKPNTTVLLTPVAGSWTNNRQPYFSWQAVTDVGGSGVAKYYIQIDTDSLFTVPLILSDSTIGTSYTPAAYLPADTRFFWRVRARDVAGNYADYATSSFGIDITAPAAPVNFDVQPDAWTTNPIFTINWTNPADPSGIARALFKTGTAPTSNFDSTGHFSGTPPGNYTMSSTGSRPIFVWLQDGAGNLLYTHYGVDTMRYDITPPSGCIASSPDTSGNPSFGVTWTAGSDIGSGLSGLYDVRVRDGLGGSWTNWLAGVSGLSAAYSGQNGHTYYFEARTTDLVGNIEPFTGSAETSTTVDTNYVGPPFVPGDANGSEDVNGLDVVFLVTYLKGGPPPPDPILRADANGSCSVNGIDVNYLVAFLKGGPPPFAGDCR